MTRPQFFSLLALPALTVPAWSQGTIVGNLDVVRQVQVTRTRATQELRSRVDREWARSGETLFDEELVYAMKRSGAQLTLKTGAVLRLHERTEVIVRAKGAQVFSGKVWVKTGKEPLELSTPIVAMSGSDATFEVVVADGTTTVYCYQGAVVVRRDERSVSLKAGERCEVTASGTQVVVGAATVMDGTERASDSGGPRPAWWVGVGAELGMLTLPGSSQGFAMRSSALTEALQASLGLPPRPSAIANDANNKARLLSLAQTSVVPSIESSLASDPTLTLSGYRQRFGAQDLAQRYPLSGSDLGFLRSNGIGNVAELFDALAASGASFGVDVRSQKRPTTSRFAYRPSSWEGPTNLRRPIFDGAARSNEMIFLGVAAAALLDGRSTLSDIAASGDVFGFTSEPQGAGLRARLYGSVGKTQYQIEGNFLRLLSGSNTNGYDALSVANLERDMGNGLSAFIGRQRFYTGPALLSLNRSQLLGERYSAAGARIQRGELTGQVAYLYDSNPDVQGAQSGFLASATRRLGGGTIGAQVLQVDKLKNGFGYSVSGTMPLSTGPGQIDAYGEVGIAPDKAGILTLGAYFPGLYQSNDIDVYVEHSSHTGLGATTTLTAVRELTTGLNLRLFVGDGQRSFQTGSGFFGGLGFSYALGRR